ncbi:hypothetical protein Ocin01_04628 [Orchesella cincta]|uniref:O-acyltransferase WSD1 C-terminal domain-containing protein n=1 Tax=Orchesella cincta TaxID=48709 RepID=A0A1D2N9X4_ORCCI|nr:hypothetical protein Ocin01_04628 [Orchesella cincta]
MAKMAYKVLHVIKSSFILSLEILVSILLSVLIVPVGLLFALINELIRVGVSAILRVQHGSKISLASEGADNIWAYKKSNNARICLSLLFCANEIEISRHRKLYMTAVLNHTTKHGRKPYDKLKKILITRLGYHCHQQDETFDIQNHVKYYPGTEASDVIVSESQLMSDILPTLFNDMDESKPQWEEIVIPRFKKESSSSPCSVRIFRYNHGYMDGASNLLLWTACMTEDQGTSFPYPVNPLLHSGRVSKCQRFLYDLSCVILGAFTMVKSVINAGRLRSRFVTINYTGKRHFGWSESISVDVLRKIKNTCKASVPSMLATAMGGAFRKLNEKFPHAVYGNPEEIIIGLVSALVPYPNHDLRNQFTVVHFPVHTGSTENVKTRSNIQRLHVINQNMARIGRDPMVYLNYFMFKYFGRFPSCLIQAMMENGGLPVVFSNVPMSTEVVEFWGNPVITAAGWPPLLTNTGLGIVTMRYADHMRFCAVADEACLSPEAVDYFLKQVAIELKDLADECSAFETVIHKRDSIIMASNDVVLNSYTNPKDINISTVTMDFRRGSIVPSQIIDVIE